MTQAPSPALPLGSTIGIIGGGQLGRMLSLAASRLGFKVHIFAPKTDGADDGPAAQVSAALTNGAYEDLGAIARFAKSCDVITYEFENVPASTAAQAAKHAPLRPGALALDIAQDRLTEKTFLRDSAGADVIEFTKIDSVFDLRRAAKVQGLPGVLKTRRFGYDGKGQVKVLDEAGIDDAYSAMKAAPAVLERFAPFVREVSIIAARSIDGHFAAYPLIENEHRNHILHTSSCPAQNDTGRAAQIAQSIMDALDYVGVMATEFFEMENGDLIVNEIAPRVHNSGHFTQDAGCCDQFEQHIRAIAGWPLGSVNPRHHMVMTNLVGKDVLAWEELARSPNSKLHLYGKAEAREGRKMGHINTVGDAIAPTIKT